MGDSQIDYLSLICQESEICLDEQVVDEHSFISLYNYDSFSDDEYVKFLFDQEKKFGFKRDESRELENSVKIARFEAITWILKTRAVFGFRFETAYLSMTYFDRFFLKRFIDSGKVWAIRLLSVACLSLAAKMEELNVPSLSEFHVEEYSFESRMIQKMELLVLNTLEWRMRSVTPFDFLHFFIIKFSHESPPSDIVSRTVELILAIMRDINLMDYQPSVVAAGAALMALNQRLSRIELEFHVNSSGIHEAEDLFTCYTLMQKLELGKIKIPKFIYCLDRSPSQLRPIDHLENSLVTCAANNKRRRVTVSNCDQNNGRPSKKQLPQIKSSAVT